jgi:hypothetical protein
MGDIFGDGLRAFVDDFEPIPLTEEILLKAGWMHWGDGIYKYSEHPNFNLWYASETVRLNYDPNFYSATAFPVKYLYLHQLQNIYQIFTGEELQINF